MMSKSIPIPSPSYGVFHPWLLLHPITVARTPDNFLSTYIPWGGVGFDEDSDEDNQMYSDAELFRSVASVNKAGTSGLGTRPTNIVKRGSDMHFVKHEICPKKKQKKNNR